MTSTTASIGLGTAPAVHAFADSQAEAWDDFIRLHPDGTVFHQLGWKQALEKTFGYDAQYLYTERDGTITGVLPLFRVQSWATGSFLVSSPFAVSGGACALDAESERLLRTAAEARAAAQNVEFLEFRTRRASRSPGYHPAGKYTAFRTRLAVTPEENLRKLPRDTRYMIRKAERSGLTCRDGLDQLDTFYGLFAISMHRLGTPVLPKAWFRNLVAELKSQVELLVVYKSDRPISGVFSFVFGDTISPYYAGAGPEANELAANNWMYWQLMLRAAARGLHWFDFGRSKEGTGAYAFKSQWNMDVETLGYEVKLVRRTSIPNFSPINPKFQLAARAWRWLPLPVASWIGPHVVRWFP